MRKNKNTNENIENEGINININENTQNEKTNINTNENIENGDININPQILNILIKNINIKELSDKDYKKMNNLLYKYIKSIVYKNISNILDNMKNKIFEYFDNNDDIKESYVLKYNELYKVTNSIYNDICNDMIAHGLTNIFKINNITDDILITKLIKDILEMINTTNIFFFFFKEDILMDIIIRFITTYDNIKNTVDNCKQETEYI